MYNATSPDTDIPVHKPATDASAVVVLLDDQTAPPGQRRSRLYQGLREQLIIDSPCTLAAALNQMQVALTRGLHAVMLLDYELGQAMQGITPRSTGTQASFSQILLFDSVRLLNGQDVDDWLESQDQRATATLTGWRSNIDQTEFARAIEQIRQRIASGETYQVNFCYAATMGLNGSPLALYREMRKHQSVPYGALIALPDGRWVLSRSPELFVQHQDGWIKAQPMKGTAGVDTTLDLAQDPKNRAENVMIVDLLRNDLGRIAVPGSVNVPEKFAVKDYGNVRQMTSTVVAQLKPGLDWLELIEAIFPCGSITGAPKRSTMQIIRELESQARGLYTGAIGWFDPPKTQGLGNFCMSVPIRTLSLSAPKQDGHRLGLLGVGAGITWSSNASQEWDECELKSAFAHRLVTPISLFETMRAQRRHGIANLQRHLARLQTSAAAMNFAVDLEQVHKKLSTTCASLPEDGEHRLRMDLLPDGEISIQTARLEPLATPVKVLVAPDTTDSSDLFLKHKTSNRARYDAAWQQAQALGAFDMLFFNERDELTEGGRSNVFVKIDGHWYTPPLDAGVLPGVMRSVLLEDPELGARQRVITRQELLKAQAVFLCNALRGALPAKLVQ